MKIQIQLKQLQLVIECNEDSIILTTDLRRIKQILINLISNAIKFTEEGYIKLRATVSSTQQSIQFSIIDTGSGIEKQLIQHLGQPYQTFSTLTNLNQSGIGLGLNLCKQLISLLGPKNYFDVETKVGVGTKFSFIIFRNLEEKQNPSESHEDILFDSQQYGDDQSENIVSQNSLYYLDDNVEIPKSQSVIWSKYKDLEKSIFPNNFTILIADDYIFNLLVLEQQLLKINRNFKIISVNNGKQAVEQFCKNNSLQSENSNKIQLIIMDCEMPVMNGYEATKNIVQKIETENYQQTVIIGYTALLGTTEEQKCLQAGMQDVLLKPSSFKDLKAKIIENVIQNNI